MYPAVKLNFISEIAANTLIIYDRFVPADKLDALRSESAVKNVSDKVEFWSMIRLLTIGHSFGEMAPGMCIKSNSQISR